MKRIWRKRWFALLVILIIIGLLIWSTRTVDGSKGGILEGASHKNGGIKAKIKSTGETVELQGNEDILTKRVNEISDQYACYGTPGGIASALNVEAGGAKFNENGRCVKQ